MNPIDSIISETDSVMMKFHKNPIGYWNDFQHLMNTLGGQNPLCRINSKSCSKDISDIADLCQWHRLRMGRHHYESCGCKMNNMCSGDTVARYMFKEYYNCWGLPIIVPTGTMYCCVSCYNGDLETHKCGKMLVGECCINLHTNLCKIKKSNVHDEEDFDEEDFDEEDFDKEDFDKEDFDN